MQLAVEAVGETRRGLSSRQLQCLRWVQVNVVQAPGTSLTTQQLLELQHAVDDDEVSRPPTEPLIAPMPRRTAMLVCVTQALAHTAMVVGAMTRHGDVVTWCMEHTSARPWVVGAAFVCFEEECRGEELFTMCHRCADSSHAVYRLAPLFGPCISGDLSLLQRLMFDHSECRDGVRDSSIRDEVTYAPICAVSMYFCRTSATLVVVMCTCSLAPRHYCTRVTVDASTSYSGWCRRDRM
jgi:hypothetical protein